MINSLLTTVRSGARNNKYKVFIPVSSDSGRNMDVLCHATTLPGRIITPTEVIIKGHKCFLAGETSLDGVWEATFYNTEDMEERKYFINWMREIHENSLPSTTQKDENSLMKIKSDIDKSFGILKNIISDPFKLFLDAGAIMPYYQREIQIHQLDNNGNTSSFVSLIGAFPTSVSSIEYVDSAGEVSTTTITFNYNDIAVGTKPKSSTEKLMSQLVDETLSSIFN